MVARLNRVRTDTDWSSDRPRVANQQARAEEDPSPDPSLLDPVDYDQLDDIRTAVKSMTDLEIDNGLPKQYHDDMRKLLQH